MAHVIHRLDFGGLENGVVNIINRMPAHRYRHAIICLQGYDREFRKRLVRPDVEVVSLDKRPGKDPGMYRRMWRALRRLRPDVVHTRNLGTVDMQWIALAAGVRHRVHGEHGWEAADPAGKDPKRLRIRRACRPAIQRYVPMSKDIETWLQREVGVSAGRIRQIYNGVDTDRFHPAAAPGAAATGPEIAGRDDFTIGTVGRLDPVKNQESLLHAFRSILDTSAGSAGHLRLLVVGDGPLRATLADVARRLGLGDRIEFAGARNDVPELLRRMDLFALPSMNEGISNTILEAMASGLPVVAAAVGGNPELVVPEVTGVLYDPDDAGGLVQGLLSYVTNRERRSVHGAAGRDRVLHNFSLDAMVAAYLALYDELMTA